MALSANIIRELRTYFLSLDRRNVMSDDLKPAVDDTLRLGSPDKKFHAIYVNRIIADEYEGVVGGGGSGSIDHANTVGVDYLTATEAAIDGNLYPLGTGAVFPSTVLPSDVAYQNSTPTFTSINVTNYVDGIAVGAHDHSGGANMGIQVSHANLLNLSADHHTIYTRWDDTETIIKKWKFSNLAEENQDFNEYVGWEVEASVAMIDDGGWVPVMSTAQAVLQTLSSTDPTYGHSYPLRIISHAQYSSIQMGASAELELRYDSNDISATIGNIILSNVDGITVGSTFEVTQAGVMTATAGYIGAWQILDDKLQSSSGDVVLDSDGYIFLKGSSVELRASSIHADYRLWIGSSGESTWDETTAKFIVNTAGQVTAETIAVKGLLHNYGSDKWKITSDGHCEFESIKARGRLDTLVFTKSTVSSISGVLALANGGVLSEDMTDSQTYFYLDAPEFGFGDIILLQPSADNMEWLLIISTYTQMVIQDADGEDITVYKYTISRDFGDYGISYSFEKGVAVNGRGSYSAGNDPLPLASGDAQGAFGDYQPSGTYTGAGGGWITLDGESTHITVNVRTGPLPEQYQQFIRIGNLQGMLNYTEIEWGFFVGDENNYFAYDQTDGLIIYSRDGATTINADGITSDAMMLGIVASAPTYITDTFILYFEDETDVLKYRLDDDGGQLQRTVATETWVSSLNYISNVVEDITPELGGPLRMNGKGIYEDSNGIYRIVNPSGGAYNGTSSADTGIIQILLPTAVNTTTMWNIEIDVFDYSTKRTFKVIAGGYTYIATPMWTNTTAIVIGDAPRDITVRFCRGGAGYWYITIGEIGTVWSYPKVSISRVTAGHTLDPIANYTDGWTISTETSFPTYIDASHNVKTMVEWADDTTPVAGGNVDLNDRDLHNIKQVDFQDFHNAGTSGTAKTINWNNGNKQKLQITGNACNISMTDPPGPCSLELRLTGNGTLYTNVDADHDSDCGWADDGEPEAYGSTLNQVIGTLFYSFDPSTTPKYIVAGISRGAA